MIYYSASSTGGARFCKLVTWQWSFQQDNPLLAVEEYPRETPHRPYLLTLVTTARDHWQCWTQLQSLPALTPARYHQHIKRSFCFNQPVILIVNRIHLLSTKMYKFSENGVNEQSSNNPDIMGNTRVYGWGAYHPQNCQLTGSLSQ